MKHRTLRLVFASPFALSLAAIVAAQLSASACSSAVTPAAPLDGGTADASFDAGSTPETSVAPLPDAAVTSCYSNKVTKEDFIDFCFQKTILRAEHAVFAPDGGGMPSSWSASTGKPDTDGGVVAHDLRDDVAYGASLATYSISAQVYGDTEIKESVVIPDMTALAALLVTELATLPASYDGELYMRLRRFAGGLRAVDLTSEADEIDAIANAYGKAIFATYFHAVAPTEAPDAGADDGGDDGSSPGDAGPEAGSDAVAPPPPILNDGVLGVPSGTGGAIAYDVDQAASGALALADLAARSQAADAGVDAVALERAVAAILNHLYLRARHPSGLYFADLVTSSDPDHDALALLPDGVTPNDALLADTQASVAASVTRLRGLANATNLALLAALPYGPQIASPLSGLAGVAPDGGAGFSLWDPTPNAATATACAGLPDASACGGSGFFGRYLPATGLDNSVKPLRANALAFAAIHRSLVFPGTAANIDYEPLSALLESQLGPSFISLLFAQNSYFPAVKGDLSMLTGSFSAQADAYAIEALTEQWIARPSCPPDFY